MRLRNPLSLVLERFPLQQGKKAAGSYSVSR